MKNIFTKAEAATATGLSKDTILLYTQRGIIVPEIANPSGSGTRRKYSRRNLVELMVAKELSDNKMPLVKILKLFEYIRADKKIWSCFDPTNEIWERLGNRAVYFVIHGAATGHPELEIIGLKGNASGIKTKEGFRSCLVLDTDTLFSEISKKIGDK